MPCRLRAVARPCSVCGRPQNLYGNMDIRTGWEGWCSICNAHWHFQEAKVLQAKTEGQLKQVSRRSVFQSTVIVSVISSYVVSPECEVRLMQTMRVKAAEIYWSRQFCLKYIRIREHDGGEREADTDDEENHGACNCDLDFVNITWKLRLSRGPNDVFRLVVTMLMPR